MTAQFVGLQRAMKLGFVGPSAWTVGEQAAMGAAGAPAGSRSPEDSRTTCQVEYDSAGN